MISRFVTNSTLVLFSMSVCIASALANQPFEQAVKGNGNKCVFPAEEAAKVKNHVLEQGKRAKAGDWPAFIDLYADDAVLMDPNTPEVRGKSTLLKLIQEKNVKVLQYDVEVMEVHGCGDIAYAKGNYAEMFASKAGEAPFSAKKKVIAILRKQADGKWKTSVWINNTNS